MEKEKELGGHGRHVKATWQGYDVQKYLKDLVSSVKKDKNIKVMTETKVKENKGFAGNFISIVEKKNKEKSVSHGVIILASGGNPINRENIYMAKIKMSIYGPS